MGKRILRTYTAEYRADAVLLAKEIGASEASKQLNIPVETLYTWLHRARKGTLPLSTVDPAPKESLRLAEKIKVLEKENSILKSQNNQLIRDKKILEEAAVFFASRQKR